MKVYIVRHAKAERRLGWDAPDALRPLAPVGLRQSSALADRLAREGVKRIVSSPHLRCIQTVEPLAAATGLPIEIDERLAEGEGGEDAFELLSEAGDDSIVLCSHGDVIPALLCELEDRNVSFESEGRLRCQKGSVWVAKGRDGHVSRIRYQPPPRVDREGEDDVERVAVLDLGSTSFRAVVFEATRAGRITKLMNERIMLRLGAAIALDGHIPDKTCDEAIATATHLGELAREAGATRLLPVGTAALRDAHNGARLARRIGKALGTEVRVVSGEEEARLLFRALRRRVVMPAGATLGVDLGGGSLELVVGDANDIHWEATLPVGVTRLHREIVDSDPMRKRDQRRLRERLVEALEPHLDAIAEYAPKSCITAGGSARAFARLSAARHGEPVDADEPHELPLFELAELTHDLVRADHEERLAFPGMRKDRADLLPTAGILLTTLAGSLDIDSYTVCDWGLREGVVLEALGTT